MKTVETVNVVYFGKDTNTLSVLTNDSRFKVQAVAKIGDFLKFKTYNPINLYFKSVYYLHLKERHKSLKIILNKIFQMFRPLSSGLFHRYSDYLDLLIKNEIKIIAYKDISRLRKFVEEKKISLFIVNVWKILPKEIVELPSLGCINVHPSSLPKYRGALPTLWALKNGDKTSAVTYFLLDVTVDGGEILASHEFPITENDDAISVNRKIDEIIAKTLTNDLFRFVQNEARLIRQSEENPSKTGMFERYKLVDFKKERAEDIFNKINFYPFQYPTSHCYALNSGKRLLFLGCQGIVDRGFMAPGNYQINSLYLLIGCKDRSIKLRLFKDINLINSCLFCLKMVRFN